MPNKSVIILFLLPKSNSCTQGTAKTKIFGEGKVLTADLIIVRFKGRTSVLYYFAVSALVLLELKTYFINRVLISMA